MSKITDSDAMQLICTHKISVQSAKSSYAYPITRLLREFHRLAGAAATIYETTHNGALAFLVVPKGLNGLIRDLDTDVYKPSPDLAEVTGWIRNYAYKTVHQALSSFMKK